MKKLYPLIVLLFVGYGLFAQDVNLGDFEDGSVGSWENWGGANTVVDNPYKENMVNTSAKVMKYVPGDAWQAVKIWKDGGVIEGSYVSLTVDVYLETAGSVQLYMDNSPSGGATYTKSKSVAAGQWIKLTFDLSTISPRDYQQLAFQNSIAGTYYFDNITLIEGTLPGVDPNKTILNNFEDGSVDSWASWQTGATVSVVDNPAATGINTTAKSLQLVTNGGWSSIAKWFGDGGFTSKKPAKLTLMVYASVATDLKLQLDNPIVTGTANVEDYRTITNPNTWTLVEYDLSALAEWGFKQMAFQPKDNGTFYFDEITVFYTETTPVFEQTQNQVRIFSNSGVLTISGQEQQNIQIYNATGAKMFEQTAAGSTVNVNLPKGLYIVVVNNKATKVIVK